MGVGIEFLLPTFIHRGCFELLITSCLIIRVVLLPRREQDSVAVEQRGSRIEKSFDSKMEINS